MLLCLKLIFCKVGHGGRVVGRMETTSIQNIQLCYKKAFEGGNSFFIPRHTQSLQPVNQRQLDQSESDENFSLQWIATEREKERERDIFYGGVGGWSGQNGKLAKILKKIVFYKKNYYPSWGGVRVKMFGWSGQNVSLPRSGEILKTSPI